MSSNIWPSISSGFARDWGLSSRVLPMNPVASGPLLKRVKPCRASQHGFNSPAGFLKTNGSWTSFVDDVKRCFRGSAETAEASLGDYLANAFFA
jgi:hypothetical protein